MSVVLTREQALARARSSMGRKTVYALGKGGFHPEADAPTPRPEIGADCSGWVLWALGTSRHRPDDPWYMATRGGWVDTTAIVLDCASPYGIFSAVPWTEALPADLLVYPDFNGQQGHVGMVSEVDADGPVKVIHCSASNFRTGGDAIAETGVRLWRARRSVRVARYAPFTVPTTGVA